MSVLSYDKEALAHLCRSHRIRRLALFGSVLRSTDGGNSDVDALIYRWADGKVPSNEFWINYGYFDEERTFGNGTVTFYFASDNAVMAETRHLMRLVADQMAASAEKARLMEGLEEANSSEFDPATPHRVIYKLRELRGVEELGGTMRLGAWTCRIEPNTLAARSTRGAFCPTTQ